MGAPLQILLVRGHHASPWGLAPFEHLPSRFRPRLLLTGRQTYDTSRVNLAAIKTRTVSGMLGVGRVTALAGGAAPDRFVGIGRHLAEADIVHTEELSLWFSADVARAKRHHDFALVATSWETIPLLEAYRSPYARRFRRQTLGNVDLFLAVSERARQALLLEGVDGTRIQVSYPGVDIERFRGPARRSRTPTDHLVISPGRLEWEKGHQDVIRAIAAVKRGIGVDVPPDVARGVRLLVVGQGPERSRLEGYARELGIGDAVEFAAVAHEAMPSLYGEATCMVLASLPRSGCALLPGDLPRCFWEEQFGLVIVEAMAAGLALVLSDSGAISEVAGDTAAYFAPGDWLGLAKLLAAGPLSRPPDFRVAHSRERLERFSVDAAAHRLARVYDSLARLPTSA